MIRHALSSSELCLAKGKGLNIFMPFSRSSSFSSLALKVSCCKLTLSHYSGSVHLPTNAFKKALLALQLHQSLLAGAGQYQKLLFLPTFISGESVIQASLLGNSASCNTLHMIDAVHHPKMGCVFCIFQLISVRIQTDCLLLH